MAWRMSCCGPYTSAMMRSSKRVRCNTPLSICAQLVRRDDERKQVERPRALRTILVGIHVVGDAVVAHFGVRVFVCGGRGRANREGRGGQKKFAIQARVVFTTSSQCGGDVRRGRFVGGPRRGLARGCRASRSSSPSLPSARLCLSRPGGPRGRSCIRSMRGRRAISWPSQRLLIGSSSRARSGQRG